MTTAVSRKDLIARARELKIKGFTKLNVAELEAAIANAESFDAAIDAGAPPSDYPKHDSKHGILQRLQRVQIHVAQVMKTGEVAFKGTSYEHIQEHGVLAVLKPLLNHYNLALVADVTAWQRDGNHVTLDMAYTVFCADRKRDDADQDSSITVRFPTEGVDQGDKAMNKALTNGMKYAMQKLFLIPTDAIDDVEGSDESHNTRSTGTAGASKATNAELARLRARAVSAVETGAINNETIKAYLSATFATSRVTDLSGEQAQKFANWLDEKGA